METKPDECGKVKVVKCSASEDGNKIKIVNGEDLEKMSSLGTWDQLFRRMAR